MVKRKPKAKSKYIYEKKNPSSLNATKQLLVHVLFELLAVLQGRVDLTAADKIPPCFPSCLVLPAFQIAGYVYFKEVDKDVQNNIVYSLCSAPEETQSTSSSVLADVTYILWFHLGIITLLPPTASAHALFERPQASIIHPALAWYHWGTQQWHPQLSQLFFNNE